MDLAAVLFAGGTDLVVDATENAPLQLVDDPTSTAANAVSLYQLAAIRLELPINFTMGRSGAISVLTNAEW